jgi:hypothetical protein
VIERGVEYVTARSAEEFADDPQTRSPQGKGKGGNGKYKMAYRINPISANFFGGKESKGKGKCAV